MINITNGLSNHFRVHKKRLMPNASVNHIYNTNPPPVNVVVLYIVVKMHRKSSRDFWSYSTGIASKQRNLISCYDDAIIRMYWEMLGNKFSKRLHDSSDILIECCIVVWQIKRWSTNYTEDGWGYGNIMTGVFMWTGGAVMIVCTRQKDSHEAGKSTYIWGGFLQENMWYKKGYGIRAQKTALFVHAHTTMF